MFKLITASVPMLVAASLYAQIGTASTASIPADFVKTNGEFVTIGHIMIKTNSPNNTDEFKQYSWRLQQLDEIQNSRQTNAQELFVEGAWELIRDFPKRSNGYQLIMAAAEDYGYEGQVEKAKSLAEKLAATSGPERYKLWAKGLLNRLNLPGKPVSLSFEAIDGRKVDLAAMKGKVVLVDFWATTCEPCVAELPDVKAAHDKFHTRGFEVIGVSCDRDKKQVQRFLEEKGYPWPQYFDGQQQERNKIAQQFGIDGIPHMFLVDKKGILRFDNVRANDKDRPKDDKFTFEEKISTLLGED